MRKLKKAAVVVQSTQNIEEVLKIVGLLKRYIKELKFFNTICRPTKIKQEEVKRMARENDVMIIIGSRTSANTRRLYEIAKASNKKSYWVQSKEQVKPEWFTDAESVGVSAGASTPTSTTKDIINQIRKLCLH
jgi:4-hydroxy-3-methylbut-2-enyl diphosphate reductase